MNVFHGIGRRTVFEEAVGDEADDVWMLDFSEQHRLLHEAGDDLGGASREMTFSATGSPVATLRASSRSLMGLRRYRKKRNRRAGARDETKCLAQDPLRTTVAPRRGAQPSPRHHVFSRRVGRIRRLRRACDRRPIGQVAARNQRIGAKFFRGSAHRDGAVEQQEGAVADRQRLVDVVVGQEHAGPGARRRDAQGRELGRPDGIDAGEGLVADDEARTSREGAREFKTPPLAPREAYDRHIEALPEADGRRFFGNGFATPRGTEGDAREGL
ncbi:hypothetical protein OUZ56_032360 [Daphnia magna]|uniref:Uncharacterized protein n=1 Tax=Daphnia magna TaxID=35525 RepID=A0ABR0B8P4_9CRUS|nr:hypothetical protein OUZ56_032360 [Daphnia magna]